MYAEMARTAEEEGFLALAAQFEGVGKIEKTHEERYLKLLDNLKKGEVFRKGEKVMWFCRNCGHVEIAESAPAVCPVCKHPQAYFQIKAQNYSALPLPPGGSGRLCRSLCFFEKIWKTGRAAAYVPYLLYIDGLNLQKHFWAGDISRECL